MGLSTLLSTTPRDQLFLILGAASVVLFFVYSVCLATYRLFFSPLSKFPGPKLAAITSWYEFYYDVILPAKYIFEIERMHKIYGPIVRINPHELSINDGDFYNKLYVTGNVRKTEAYSHFFCGLGLDDSHLLTQGHDLHRRRRKPLEPFFSRKGISNLQPLLADLSRQMMERLQALKGSGSIIQLDHLHLAYCTDLITKMSFDSYPTYLDQGDFGAQWFNLLHSLLFSFPLFSNFPGLISVLRFIPKIVVSCMPHSHSLLVLENAAKQSIATAVKENETKSAAANGKHTLFRHMLRSDMPESELSPDRMVMEAKVMLAAGSFTPARTLDFVSYYVLSRPDIRNRLREEVKDVMAKFPDEVPTLSELEQLPYLQAVIKEGLRLSYGTMRRLPRVSPDMSLFYHDYHIPPGTPVGMSAYLVHTDPLIYKDPFKFDPERWLGDVDPLMNRNFVPFTKGSRSCLGMNLALAELYLVVALHCYQDAPELELFETNESDVIPVHDFIGALPDVKSKGLRVRVL
ncbi:cytochrome P450 [Aspergillus aurantiobrunneus]